MDKTKEQFCREIASLINSGEIESTEEIMEKARAAAVVAETPFYPAGFQGRLMEIEGILKDRFFGLTHEIVSTKMLRRDRSNEALVEALLCSEKYFSDKKVINEQIDCFEFLKLVLERDASLFQYEEYLFGDVGIVRDRSGISVPEKNKIAVQLVAQVLWHLQKSEVPTIEEMGKVLRDKKNNLYKWLGCSRFSSRVIENWIRDVCPVHKKSRKIRPSQRKNPDSLFDRLVLIPGIYLENRTVTNFPKLRFALVCVTRVLRDLGWPVEQIICSKFVNFYTQPLGFEFLIIGKYLVDGWVRGAFSDDGNIFT